MLLFVVVVAVAAGALGYWRGWFILTNAGTVDVHVDTDTFKQDKDALSKSLGEKVPATKNKIASLRKTSEELTSDLKDHTQQEIKHDRLEQQITELDNAGQDSFESIRQDLSKTLEEVEKKIEELTTQLDQEKEKQRLGRTPGQ